MKKVTLSNLEIAKLRRLAIINMPYLLLHFYVKVICYMNF